MGRLDEKLEVYEREMCYKLIESHRCMDNANINPTKFKVHTVAVHLAQWYVDHIPVSILFVETQHSYLSWAGHAYNIQRTYIWHVPLDMMW